MVSENSYSRLPTPYQQKPHVLVVDDEISNRMLLRRILERENYRVTEAEHARQALALLESDSFDLILLDIMMPQMTGLELLGIIRNIPEIEDLPVILISALSSNTDIVAGLRTGASDYIPKPFDVDVVLARVNTHIKLKKMMDVQKQSIAELEAAQQMKDRLFRIASHDLKSPLSNVAMAEVLLRQFLKDEPSAMEILDTLRMTVHNMDEVIIAFLDMAACQSGGISVQLAPINVQQAVMDVVVQYNRTAFEKHITLDIGDLAGQVYADEARLGQILSNLVSNAIKFSPQETTITVWSEYLDGDLRIQVADQGPGIPADERQHLFQEFSKLSTRPTGGEGSTGLGLWIVKHLVTLQNGTVGVECPPSGGSIFWVTFPAVETTEFIAEVEPSEQLA